MGRGDDDVLGPGVQEHLDGLGDGAAGVDHVIDQDAGASLDVADDAVGHRLVGAGDVAGLVDEGQRGAAELVGPALGHPDAAGVGGDDGGVGRVDAGAHIVHEHRLGPQVVPGAVEEALLLGGVQVHAHEAVGAGGLVEVGHEAGADGLASQVLLVLTGVGEEGGDHGDALGGGALEGVNHDELLHEPVVDAVAVGLDDEHVAAAHRLVEADVGLPVGEVVGRGGQHLGAELAGHVPGELGMGASGDDDQPFLTLGNDARHDVVPFSRPVRPSM